MLDSLIAGFDRALRAVAGVHDARRPTPADAAPEAELTDDERRHAAALMRVNHVGEVCAQALYQGQALTTRDAMRADEAKHRDTAVRLGAAELPVPARRAMRLAARVMTTVAYRV